MSAQPFRDPPAAEPALTLAVRAGVSPLRVLVAAAAGLTAHLLVEPTQGAITLVVVLIVLAAGRFFRLEVKLDAANRTLVIERSFLGALRSRTTTDLSSFRSAEVAASALSDPTRKISGWKRPNDWVVMLVTAEGERRFLPGWAARLRDTGALVKRLDDALHPGRAPVVAPPRSEPTAIVSCRMKFEYAFMVLIAGSFGAFVSLAMTRRASPLVFLSFLFLPLAIARAFPHRKVVVYANDGQLAVVTSYFGLFPQTQSLALSQVQRVIVDQRGARSGAALLLDDGHHVPLTAYSNASFGLASLVTRLNMLLGKQAAPS